MTITVTKKVTTKITKKTLTVKIGKGGGGT
jgi:hypothetical protein